MILVLISPRNAGLPFAQWLPEQRGRLVAVTAAGVALGEGFAEVVTVIRLLRRRRGARRSEGRRQASPASGDPGSGRDRRRASRPLRSEFNLPGLDTVAAAAYRDKILMKKFAQAAGHSGSGLRSRDQRRRNRRLHGGPSGTGRRQATRRFRFHRRLRPRNA